MVSAHWMGIVRGLPAPGIMSDTWYPMGEGLHEAVMSAPLSSLTQGHWCQPPVLWLPPALVVQLGEDRLQGTGHCPLCRAPGHGRQTAPYHACQEVWMPRWAQECEREWRVLGCIPPLPASPSTLAGPSSHFCVPVVTGWGWRGQMAGMWPLMLVSMTALLCWHTASKKIKKARRKISGHKGSNPSLGLCKENKNSSSVSGSSKPPSSTGTQASLW